MAFHYREVRSTRICSPPQHEQTLTGTIESPRLSPPRPTPLHSTASPPPPPPPGGYRGVYPTAGNAVPLYPQHTSPTGQLLSPPGAGTRSRANLSQSKGPSSGPSFRGGGGGSNPNHSVSVYTDSRGEGRTLVRDVSILKKGLHPPAAKPGHKTAMDWVRYEDAKARNSPNNRRASSPFRDGSSRFGNDSLPGTRSSPTRTYDRSYFVRPLPSSTHDHYIPPSSVVKSDYPGADFRRQDSGRSVNYHNQAPIPAPSVHGPTRATAGGGGRPLSPPRGRQGYASSGTSSPYSRQYSGGGGAVRRNSPKRSLMESATPRGPLLHHGKGLMSPVVGRR